MYNDSLHVGRSKDLDDGRSNVLRSLTVAPTDSWEIELDDGRSNVLRSLTVA